MKTKDGIKKTAEIDPIRQLFISPRRNFTKVRFEHTNVSPEGSKDALMYGKMFTTESESAEGGIANRKLKKGETTMKRFSNALWCAVLAVVVFVCYFCVPALHMDGFIYAGCILIGAFAAYLQDALTSKERKKRMSNALWCAVFAVIVFVCYFLISALHYDGMLYAGFILIGAFVAYLQDAMTKEKA